ncbi:TIGR04197 family type VII secretion effector [Listeria booriae]|uniref:TIGR04197 family type VII secretion effector n=1 Tax=Listeria booriae TaxID=1552123 RepID=A0A7X0XCD6_9LIST|nr:TIGR04197 family type VII secretion effector [Listeria booriae]MBC1491502.1 TIGR04197 family type VII secretion effector [Listeria booriae]MBC1505065.1 TIGR04197 family type VII secretion effector [Listeria booriae]MBC1531577.1 TIGR04197 family type VII secretion effector [Listeria booriae]MBC6136297.1 TIGR04197 family type VII secretion effector [Listeria booriae]
MSGEVASNSNVVNSQVYNLQQAVADLKGVQTPNTDTQTTLQGNNKLHSATGQEMNMIRLFCEAFREDAAKIGRIAAAIEAKDKQLAQKGE